MSEAEPRPRFANRRDEILWTLSTAGWCNASSGDVQASTGWFALICIDNNEIEEVFGVVEDQAELGEKPKLVGNFLLVETPEGVTVNEYEEVAEVKRHYIVMTEAYEQWKAGQP